MMRKLTLAALTLGVAFALSPGIANAAHGGFPAGARLYGFGGPPVVHTSAKSETAKALSVLPGPLDFLKATIGVPTRPLEYPFLNSVRCEDQNASGRSCATAATRAVDGSVAGPSFVVQ